MYGLTNGLNYTMLIPEFEKQIITSGAYSRVVGIDEAGRGCWAGPVHVGAYVYDSNTTYVEGVDDSKNITSPKRFLLYEKLCSTPSNIIIRTADNRYIDKFGIGKAISNIIAEIISEFDAKDTYFIVDGQFAQRFGNNVMVIPKADSTYYSVGAASILAKVSRDEYMKEMDAAYPGYDFFKHKGYGTKLHLELLKKNGASSIHRHSFRPICDIAGSLK